MRCECPDKVALGASFAGERPLHRAQGRSDVISVHLFARFTPPELPPALLSPQMRRWHLGQSNERANARRPVDVGQVKVEVETGQSSGTPE